MKLIIDIPEEKYEWVKKNNPNADTNSIVGVIVNGTPVSTEGDLISRSELIKAFEHLASDDYENPLWYESTVFRVIDNAPTVDANKIIDGLHNQIDDLSYSLAWFNEERIRLKSIVNGKIEERPQGEWENGYVFALDKAFFKFDANCTYSGDRVLQILEKLKEEKGGAE